MPIRTVTSAPRASQATRRFRPVQRIRHIAALILLLSGLALGAFFIATNRVPSAHASPSRYGPDESKVTAAVQAAAWPQQQHIWCGVAAAAAVANFRGASVSQSAVAGALNSASTQSEWGTPAPSGDSWGPGFQADIARDGGMDPRAHAAALAHATGAGYHEAVDYTGSWTATSHLVADLLRAQEPIIAIVDHGAHSVLVAGVYANNGNPYNLNDVTGLEVWDPGVGSVDTGVQAAQEEVVSLNSWLYARAYWGQTYNENWSGSRMLDPDPAIGPYTYDPTSGRNQHLWIGHYVYIRPDSGGATSGVSPDWAFNQNVALIRGYNGEIPAGYTGPSVALYTPPPPPPPTPTPRPKPTATATPLPTWTPRGAVVDPTQPWENETVTASTPSVSAQPTAASGSLLSFSLQQVCFGSNCTPGAPWALGGGFLLAAVLLLAAGLILLRVRRRKASLTAAPAALPAAVPSVATPVAASAQREAAAPEMAEAGEQATGPLARLAGAAARLDGLAEGMPESPAPEVEVSTAEALAGAAPEAETESAETERIDAAGDVEAPPDQQDVTLAALAAEVAAEGAEPTTRQADTAPGDVDTAVSEDAVAAAMIPESERTS